VGESRESVLLSRNLLHLDLHPARDVRLFAQAGAFFAIGSPVRDVPPNADLLDVTQLFVETKGRVGSVDVTARVGRQEMALGSTRWVSVRDRTNMRQSFDIGRLSLGGDHDRWSSQTFAGLVPLVDRGVFNDKPNEAHAFWGSYWTVHVLPDKAFS